MEAAELGLEDEDEDDVGTKDSVRSLQVELALVAFHEGTEEVWRRSGEST